MIVDIGTVSSYLLSRERATCQQKCAQSSRTSLTCQTNTNRHPKSGHPMGQHTPVTLRSTPSRTARSPRSRRQSSMPTSLPRNLRISLSSHPRSESPSLLYTTHSLHTADTRHLAVTIDHRDNIIIPSRRTHSSATRQKGLVMIFYVINLDVFRYTRCKMTLPTLAPALSSRRAGLRYRYL